MSVGFWHLFDRWRPTIRRLSHPLIETFLPSACANCGRPGTIFCPTCLAMVRPISRPICDRCGRPGEREAGVCRACRKASMPLDRSRAALRFAPPLRRVIHRFKYDGLYALAEPLAEMMAQWWPTWEMPVDLVLPIPLHPRRERRRGFNQSALLVDGLARRLGWSTAAEAIQRRRHTRPQTHLPASQRHSNVQGAFWADRTQVAGKRVLLVDDVFTTGATLAAAAEALRQAGALSVSAYCLSLAAGDDVPTGDHRKDYS